MESLPPHFFRHESARLVARLSRVFGLHNLPLVEDVVQEALGRALEVWKIRGLPEDPSAWLTASARNRAIDLLRRERTARAYAPEVGRLLESEWTLVPTVDDVLAGGPVRDDELRMMFTICHPRLAEEVQVALALQLVSGFSVREIAAAFFSSDAAIEKRLQRGRRALSAARSLFDLTGDDLPARLPQVQRALYLLFNEGYHGAGAEAAVRQELCGEAIRLAQVLVDHPVTSAPSSLALAALFCLHGARLAGRTSPDGRLLPLFEQDRGAWDGALIETGIALLDRACQGREVSEFHVEAAIAACHARARGREDTPWEQIVALYDALLRLRPSPVAALSRAIALAEARGPERGLEALGAIDGGELLARYPFYHATLGELHRRAGRSDEARAFLGQALALARSPMERRFFEERLAAVADPAG